MCHNCVVPPAMVVLECSKTTMYYIQSIIITTVMLVNALRRGAATRVTTHDLCTKKVNKWKQSDLYRWLFCNNYLQVFFACSLYFVGQDFLVRNVQSPPTFCHVRLTVEVILRINGRNVKKKNLCVIHFIGFIFVIHVYWRERGVLN